MRKSRRKRRRRRRTRRRGAGKKRRKQTFQPWQGKHSFNNNNLDNISHKSVESYGNFPDTTNGELSVEIEGQQPRDDGGGGPGVQLQARNDAPKNTYYYSQGFKALGDGSPSGLAQALAAAPEAEKEAALWKAKTAVAWDGRRRRGKDGADARRRLGMGRGFQDQLTRQSLLADAAAGKGRVTPDNAAAHGFAPISPVMNLSAVAIGRTEEREAAAEMIDAERSAAAATKDKKVLAAADRAAAEYEAEIAAASAKADVEGEDPDDWPATGGDSPLPPAGGRRRKRRRTRKKRGGYGPITTGNWISHNLLLPSQHLGSLGMWWTGGRR